MAHIEVKKLKTGTRYKIWYYDADGKHRSKTVRCSRKEAEEIAVKLEAKKSLIRAGVLPPQASKDSLSGAVDAYHANGEKSKADGTIVREKKVFKSLKEKHGDVPLARITTDQLEAHLNERLAGGVSPAGAALELRTIKAFFSAMVKRKKLTINPTIGINPPKQQPKTIRFLTEAEIEKLLKKVDDDDYRDLILAYLNTGARRSEILSDHFTWVHVQFDLDRIKIQGKGDKVRYVPMNRVLREILERRKADGKAAPFEMSYSWVFKKIKKYLEDAEIENANVHCLRRTFGSLLIAKGVDIFRVSKLLGHANVRVTQDYYADLLKEDLADCVSRLETVFSDDDTDEDTVGDSDGEPKKKDGK